MTENNDHQQGQQLNQFSQIAQQPQPLGATQQLSQLAQIPPQQMPQMYTPQDPERD